MRDAIFAWTTTVGKKIVVRGERIISQFELGSKWKYDRGAETWERSTVQRDKLPPQISFSNVASSF